MIRASNSLTNEILGIRSSNGEAWWEKQKIDSKKAFNDAVLLQNGFHVLLQNHFHKDPKYSFYMDAFMFAIRSITVGRMLRV